MILIVAVSILMVYALALMFVGFWVQRPKVDWADLDAKEKDVGIGPPYSSEFPKLRTPIKEREW